MKKFLKTALLAAAVSALCMGVANAKVYKFATNFPDDGAPGRLLTEFAQNVQDKTDGRVKFKFFWNGTLGGQGQYLQQIKSGVVDLGVVNSAELESIVPEVGVLNLPYVFKDTDDYAKVMLDDGIYGMLQNFTHNGGVELTGFLNNATRGIYSKKPINSIEDLKGLKIRTNASQVYIDMFAAWGAVATPIDFSEVFASLQQGLIDGAEGGLAGMYEMNFGEVAPYGVNTDHARLTDFVISSTKFAGKVGEEDMKIVNDEMRKTIVKSMKYVDDNAARSIKLAVTEKGCTIVDIDKAPLMKAVEPIYEKAAQNPVQKPLLEAIFKLQGREI